MNKLFSFLLLGSMGLLQAQNITLTVLGVAQDAGAPQINCSKDCCSNQWDKTPTPVVALGVSDQKSNRFFLFEATPDLPAQHQQMKNMYPRQTFGGVFITHAHIGHYSGLMYLGKEAMGATKVPVFVMPRMGAFLQENAPWEQLITEKNIEINQLNRFKKITLSPSLQITPIQVPHRDEYSETVGYLIEGEERKALFIPDIDKWERWNTPIEKELAKVDYAFLDATFFDGTELPQRDMSSIPHPFVIESLKRWENLSDQEKSKIYLIHFNHTNPLLNNKSTAVEMVKNAGINIAEIGQQFQL